MAISHNNDTLGVTKYGNIGVAIAIVGVLIAIIVPLPPTIIDLLLTFNIGMSLMVLLSTIYVDRSLDL